MVAKKKKKPIAVRVLNQPNELQRKERWSGAKIQDTKKRYRRKGKKEDVAAWE